MTTATYGTAIGVIQFNSGNTHNFAGQVVAPAPGVTLPATLSSTGVEVAVSMTSYSSASNQGQTQFQGNAILFDTAADAEAYVTAQSNANPYGYYTAAYPA